MSRNLHPHGDIDTVHANGLISYKHFPVRSDGLSELDAAENHLDIVEAKVEAAKQRHARPDVMAALRKELKVAQKAYTKAGGVQAKLKDVEKQVDAEWGGLEGEAPEEEPSSFSRIPMAHLHDHLGIKTTAATAPSDDKAQRPDTYKDLRKAGSPFLVELKAGQMLYLPASWWHEVTSTSPDGQPSSTHMAFNYWFHPPDGLKDFDEPYQDATLWRHLRKTAKKTAASLKPKANFKRKSSGGEEAKPRKIRKLNEGKGR